MNLNCLPNFFILGAAKCGTSSIYYYLKQHPEIFLPKDKEPHFFNNDNFWNEGLEVYLNRHFQGAEQFPVRGDATPAYFHRWKKVIPRMKEVYGETNPKFILVFRNPVERAFSHYLHCVRNRTETESFERALELEPKRLAKDPFQWVGYFTDGLYAKQLAQWLKHFPQENFLFLLTEDLRGAPEQTVKTVFEFLRVDPSVKVNISAKKNPASIPRWSGLNEFLAKPSLIKRPIGMIIPRYLKKRLKWWIILDLNRKPMKKKPNMDKKIVEKLKIAYHEDVEALAHIIGRDLSYWLEK